MRTRATVLTFLLPFGLSVPGPRAQSPAASAQSAVLSGSGFAPPDTFLVVTGTSKIFDFNHEPMEYRKGAATERIDPEGKTWSIRMNIVPPNKTAEASDATMRTALKAQGWDTLTPNGTLIARRVQGKSEYWFKGAAFSGDYRATIVEVGPPPHSLTLPAPAPVPEAVSDATDFPYLLKFPGATLKRTTTHPDKTLDATAPGGAKEQLMGPPVVEKIYELPASVSPYEEMVVYRDAFAKAGWVVIRAAAGGDALIVGHYAKNGRDIYGYVHNETVSVADVGVTNDAKKLADVLARSGHVAIYGIYFDVDTSVLRPDSETALQHILELLKGDAKLAVEIQGHTDSTGTPAHNKTLSDDRSASVQRWLVDHGIAATRLTAKGYGETQPVGDNKTPDGRAKNRRVELKK